LFDGQLSKNMTDYQVIKKNNYFAVEFQAMASPCEVLLYSDNKKLVRKLAKIVVDETKRIEAKYSRYQKDNLCWELNHSNGEPIAIDLETYKLLEYAKQLYQLSDFQFDITSGVLRKIWQFKPGAKPPTQNSIKQILPSIGFDKIQYNQQTFTMPQGMEVDFGGIGKEYCVDSAASLISPLCEKEKISFLVNFGGDLIAVNNNSSHPSWTVGLENVGSQDKSQTVIEVSQGAIATSGSTKRVFEYQGKQYTHILNPITGYPVEDAPRSVSVFAQTCSLAGGMSTLAQLKGSEAESFLKDCQVKYICCW